MIVRAQPATPERWDDLAALFGPRGACAGCWCMYWRTSARAFVQGKGQGNREALRRRVEQGPPPGLIGYDAGAPIAWCAIGPRRDFPRLENSRILAPVDERPVWSITCLFVSSEARGRGVSRAMIAAAARWAGVCGATLVVARRSETRPIVRREPPG